MGTASISPEFFVQRFSISSHVSFWSGCFLLRFDFTFTLSKIAAVCLNLANLSNWCYIHVV